MAQTQWSFDPTHSRVGFVIRHMVFAKVRGAFNTWSGTFSFDPEDPASGSVTAQIDVASVDTGNADRDNHLRSAEFFNAEQLPHISFKSTSFEAAGDKRLKVAGELTIRDVTRPVVLNVEYGGSARDPWGNLRAGFELTGKINRKDFGLTWNQALEAGGVLVGEDVEFDVQVQAVAQG